MARPSRLAVGPEPSATGTFVVPRRITGQRLALFPVVRRRRRSAHASALVPAGGGPPGRWRPRRRGEPQGTPTARPRRGRLGPRRGRGWQHPPVGGDVLRRPDPPVRGLGTGPSGVLHGVAPADTDPRVRRGVGPLGGRSHVSASSLVDADGAYTRSAASDRELGGDDAVSKPGCGPASCRSVAPQRRSSEVWATRTAWPVSRHPPARESRCSEVWACWGSGRRSRSTAGHAGDPLAAVATPWRHR